MDPVFQKEHKTLPLQVGMGDNLQLISQRNLEIICPVGFPWETFITKLASWRPLIQQSKSKRRVLVMMRERMKSHRETNIEIVADRRSR